jgi:hypothetical protein
VTFQPLLPAKLNQLKLLLQEYNVFHIFLGRRLRGKRRSLKSMLRMTLARNPRCAFFQIVILKTIYQDTLHLQHKRREEVCLYALFR